MSENTSAFRELRLAAGYKTAIDFARQLGFPQGTVSCWETRGYRPQLRHIAVIAKAFGRDRDECISKIWHESLGDPCPSCDRGVKVIPNYEHAKHLYVEHRCRRCGNGRITARTNGQCFEICRPCQLAEMRVDQIRGKCIGYSNFYDHKDAHVYHATKCLKEIRVPAHKLKLYRTTDDGESVFLAKAEGTYYRYRCVNCANSISIIRKRKKRVKEFMTWLVRFTGRERQEIAGVFKRFELEWSPSQALPTIRSFAELRNLEKACLKVSRGFSVSLPWGGLFQPGHKIHTARPQDENSKQQRLIGHLCREASARAVKGFCLLCDKLLFSAQYPIRVHSLCFEEYQRARGRERWYEPVSERPRKGVRATVESLQRNYHWMTRHLLKRESLAQIAKTESQKTQKKITKISVWKGINFIINHLPMPDQVPAHFRERISMFRAMRQLG